MENEKLRNLDNIREEEEAKQAKKNAPLVLDPAPLPRRSFGSQGLNSVTPPNQSGNPAPPPPPSLPKVLRTDPEGINHNENSSVSNPSPLAIFEGEAPRNGLDTPKYPPRGVSPPPPPPPPLPLERLDSSPDNEDFPLPPPSLLQNPDEDISPSDKKKGKPEIHFPPPPGPPPPLPPPPPPLPESATQF